MNPEAPPETRFFGNERRTFPRLPLNTPEPELPGEQTFKTTCQEIVELYSMLRHKSIPGNRLPALVQYPVIMVPSFGGEPQRKILT
ncbi:MAG: hypothetical protein M0T70_17910 [Geobacteraceae bacterium]|nr:hypothetical protein [Geobacteraceae bacterium]